MRRGTLDMTPFRSQWQINANPNQANPLFEHVMAPSSSQDVAVLLPVAISLVTTVTTILVHAIAFAAIVRFVRLEYHLGRAGAQFWIDVAIIAGVTLLAFVAHLVEIAIWAVVLEFCGEFTRLATAFYHSAVNYSSLGYGDIVMSNSWKLLGPFEAADGMLMFGVSTAMIFAVVQQLVRTRAAGVLQIAMPRPDPSR